MSAMEQIPRISRATAPLLGLAVMLWALPAHADGLNQIRSLSYTTEEADKDATPGTTTIRIRGSATPTFTVYKLDRPARVVIDIAGAALDTVLTGETEDKATWAVNSWSVGQVSAHPLEGTGREVVRVLVGQARPGTYKVTAQGTDVVVTMTPREPAPPQADAESAARAVAAARAQAARAEAAAEHARAEAARAGRRADAEAKRAADAERLAKLSDARARTQARAGSGAPAGEAKKTRAEAARARKLARASQAEAERARQAAARSDSEAERARILAANSQAEAERARQAAGQAKAEAERMSANAAQARAELERLRGSTRASKAELARAKQAAETARSAAAQAQADAERARQAAGKRDAAAERARQAANQARVEAEQIKKQAAEREAAATLALASAAKSRAEAEKIKKQAAERGAAADRALASAAQSQAEAEKVKEQARARSAEAEKATREAREVKAAAERARAEAEAAQRAAAEARAAAERMKRTAEETRAAAEIARIKAAAEGEAFRKRAEAEAARAAQAIAEARAEAEAAKTRAEERARVADGRMSEAESLMQSAESRLAGAREIERRARAAKAAADKAASEVSERERQAAKAEREAKERQQAAVRAELAAGRYRKEAAAVRSETEAQKLHQRAEAAAQDADKRRAEAEAAARTAENIRRQAEAAAQAAEDRQKQAMTALAAAKQERAEAEAERAAAEERRRQAETLRKQAEARRAEAERKLAAEQAGQRRATSGSQARGKQSGSQARHAGKPAAARAGTASAKAAVAVSKIEFVDQDDTARVVLELSGPAEPKVVSASGRKAILEVTAAEIPAKLERTLDTSRYRGPIKSISSYRDPRQSDRVRVVVELSEPVASTLKRSGTTYYWDFAKPVAAKAGKSTDPARPASTVRTQSYPPPVVGGYGASSAPITQKTVAQLAQRKKKVYRGAKIDLDFKDADIHNLLRLLADVGGVNIVIPDEVQARVTVRLRRVPWDQALEVILASKGLWYRREGNLFRVAPRKQLDAEDQAEAERLANLAKAEAPEPQVFTLNYAVAADLKTQIEPLLSPKGKAEVDTRTNSLIINDIRANRRRIIELLTRLDTQTPQIQIEARIVEARSTFVREFGVQWGGNASASIEGGNATGLIFPSSLGVRGGAVDAQTQSSGISATPPDFAVNLPASVGSGSGGALGVSLGSVGGNFNINLRLSALEDSGSVRIISAPRITVLNNVLAEISQGVSIPVSVISANGVQTQFVPADLSLKVTPHVSQRDCSIQMDLDVSKNEADFVNTGARGDPTILRKEAKTTILIADGETTVMGGIYSRNTGLSYSKVPFLGDLPVFGWFFKNRRENDERTEVLIFITPKITNKAFLRCE